MTTHLELVSGGRPRELPATWEAAEGRAIAWSDWCPPLRLFVCPPPPVEELACPGCGEVADYETAGGRLMPHRGETVSDVEIVASKRVPGSTFERRVNRPARPYIRFLAMRCVVCGHVEVYDELEVRSS